MAFRRDRARPDGKRAVMVDGIGDAPDMPELGSMRQAARRTLSTIVRQPSTCSPDQTPGVGRKKKPIHSAGCARPRENDRPAERRFRAGAGALVLSPWRIGRILILSVRN